MLQVLERENNKRSKEATNRYFHKALERNGSILFKNIPI